MVGILAFQIIDVQRYFGVIHETTEEFPEQIDIEITDTGTGISDIVR